MGKRNMDATKEGTKQRPFYVDMEATIAPNTIGGLGIFVNRKLGVDTRGQSDDFAHDTHAIDTYHSTITYDDGTVEDVTCFFATGLKAAWVQEYLTENGAEWVADVTTDLLEKARNSSKSMPITARANMRITVADANVEDAFAGLYLQICILANRDRHEDGVEAVPHMPYVED